MYMVKYTATIDDILRFVQTEKTNRTAHSSYLRYACNRAWRTTRLSFDGTQGPEDSQAAATTGVAGAQEPKDPQAAAGVASAQGPEDPQAAAPTGPIEDARPSDPVARIVQLRQRGI